MVKMNEFVIKVKNLSKEFRFLKREPGLKGSITTMFSRNYKIVDALKNVSFEIKKGEFLGIIGPNGAGKSTLVKILTGILTPTKGEAKALGLIPYKQRQKYTKNIGVVFGQRTQLWWDLPVKDSFELIRNIYNIPEKIYKENLKKFSEILNIDKYFSKPVRKLSLGERIRCDLAASLIHNPEIIFLDEPTVGLDVEAKHRIRWFLKDLNKLGVTIILTTHDMGDIEELCPRIIIIDKGRKIYDDTLSQIRKKFSKEKILTIDFFGFDGNEKFKWKGVKFLEREGDIVKLSVNTKKTLVSDVIKTILSKHPVQDISIEEPKIEEIIREIYKKGI
jgi:ABC-2 type transport system ATP-binding protein